MVMAQMYNVSGISLCLGGENRRISTLASVGLVEEINSRIAGSLGGSRVMILKFERK